MNEALDPPVLEVKELCKNFGGLQVLRRVTTSIPSGQVRAVIGPNGAGKTTFINVMTGVHPATSGAVFLQGREITALPTYRIARKGLARTFQIASLFNDLSVSENVAVARNAARAFRADRDDAMLRPGFGDVFRQDRADEEIVEDCLDLVGLSPMTNRPVSEISHGDQKLLEVAIAIASDPVVLLLDEPTAGMSPSETDKFIELVNDRLRHRYSLVIVEHDMQVVMNTADVISVLALGGILAEGSPGQVKADAKVQEAYLGSAYA